MRSSVSTPQPSAPAAPRAQTATWLTFFVNGLIMALWVLGIPTVRDHLQLTPGVLGLALLAIPVGSLVSMPLTGGWVHRWGSRRVTYAAGLLLAVALLLPFLASGLGWLLAALFVFGFGNGSMDVAMNAQGVTVERTLARPVMSGFHAGFSLGNLAGAGLGSLLTLWGTPPLAQVSGVALASLLTLSLLRPALLPRAADQPEAAEDGAPAPLPSAALWGALTLVGALCFLGMLVEGAVSDWSTLYLRDDLQASPAAAGLGFAAFSGAMTLARAFGDRLRTRLDDARVVTLGALLAAVGLGVGVLVPLAPAAWLGFAAFGLGVANIVPVLYGAGGRAGGGRGIARVSTIGYLGFMAGPPMIGFVAQHASLRLSLLLVALLALTVALLAPGFLKQLKR